jgi:hypothetical protein
MGVGRLVSSPLASLRLSADSRDRTKVLPYNDSGSHRAAKYVDELRPSGRKQKPEVGKSHDVERAAGYGTASNHRKCIHASGGHHR